MVATSSRLRIESGTPAASANLKLGLNLRLESSDFRRSGPGAEREAPADCAAFDPVGMGELFEEGRRQALAGAAWRDSPSESATGSPSGPAPA